MYSWLDNEIMEQILCRLPFIEWLLFQALFLDATNGKANKTEKEKQTRQFHSFANTKKYSTWEK